MRPIVFGEDKKLKTAFERINNYCKIASEDLILDPEKGGDHPVHRITVFIEWKDYSFVDKFFVDLYNKAGQDGNRYVQIAKDNHKKTFIPWKQSLEDLSSQLEILREHLEEFNLKFSDHGEIEKRIKN